MSWNTNLPPIAPVTEIVDHKRKRPPEKGQDSPLIKVAKTGIAQGQTTDCQPLKSLSVPQLATGEGHKPKARPSEVTTTALGQAQISHWQLPKSASVPQLATGESHKPKARLLAAATTPIGQNLNTHRALPTSLPFPKIVQKVINLLLASSARGVQPDIPSFFRNFKYCVGAGKVLALNELVTLYHHFKSTVRCFRISSDALDVLIGYQNFLLKSKARFLPLEMDVHVTLKSSIDINRFGIDASELVCLSLTNYSNDPNLWKEVMDFFLKGSPLKLTNLTLANDDPKHILALCPFHLGNLQHVSMLKHFRIVNFIIDDFFIATVNSLSFLENLESLSFRDCHFVPGVFFPDLLSSKRLKGLKSLELPTSAFGDINYLINSIDALKSNAALGNLERLVVPNNPYLLIAAIEAVVSNQVLTNLKIVECCGDARLPYAWYQKLMAAQHLRSLNISNLQFEKPPAIETFHVEEDPSLKPSDEPPAEKERDVEKDQQAHSLKPSDEPPKDFDISIFFSESFCQ